MPMARCRHVPRLASRGLLFVLSAAHVFALVPAPDGRLRDARTVSFSPYDAPGFVRANGVSERDAINGHYDVEAADATVDGACWKLRYVRSAAASPSHPDGIELVSRDAGRTFDLDERRPRR